MERKIFIAGASFCVLSVVLGAFGAHALKASLSEASLQTFETGVRYQMYHGLLLLILGMLPLLNLKTKKLAAILVGVGVVLFSGSIYLLATNSMTNFDFKTIGFITPIGGTVLIFAWLIIIKGFVKKIDNN
ncbi:MAG: hypothetical protein BM564_04415 [Bacteroidetes bacterium MedPE-SWsnd-G2]|nr:MAG: hypothetical protein BM564_04415 [Bacteroidetes bacterium MedPE-SWsnd-G2]